MKGNVLKALHLALRFPVPGETFIWGPVLRLRASGYPTTLAALGKNPTQQVSFDEELNQLSEEAHYFPIDLRATFLRMIELGVQSPYYGAWSFRRGTLKDFFRDGLLLSKAHSWNSKSHHDIFHCHFGVTGIQVCRLKKRHRLKGKIITAFYGFDASRIPSLWGHKMYRDLFEHGTLFTVPSRHMLEALVALGCPRGKIVRVPLSVREEFFRWSPRKRFSGSKLKIVTVGRLVEKKGIAESIQSLIPLQRKFSVPVELNIYGVGPLIRPLKGLVRNLNLEEQVRFHGWGSSQEIAFALNEADVFLLPSSQSLSQEFEGTPTAILESLAMGCPVVSTRHGGIPEVLGNGDYGILLEDNRPLTIAEAIARTHSSGSLSKKIAEGTAHIRRHHSESAVVQKWQEIYSST